MLSNWKRMGQELAPRLRDRCHEDSWLFYIIEMWQFGIRLEVENQALKKKWLILLLQLGCVRNNRTAFHFFGRCFPRCAVKVQVVRLEVLQGTRCEWYCEMYWEVYRVLTVIPRIMGNKDQRVESSTKCTRHGNSQTENATRPVSQDYSAKPKLKTNIGERSGPIPVFRTQRLLLWATPARKILKWATRSDG